MSIFQIYILTTKIVYVAAFTFLSAGFCFGETENTLTPENVNPEQIKIILDVWPKKLSNGDCCYVTFTVENQTDQPITINPHDMFETFRYDGSQIPYIKIKIPGIPMVRFTGNSDYGSFAFAESRRIQLKDVAIEPKTTQMIFAERFVALINPGYLKRLEKDVNDPHELEITNFSEKYKGCIQSPLPTFYVLERDKTQSKLIYNFLHSNMDVGGCPIVKTKSGYFSLFLFFTAQKFGFLQYTWHRELPNLSAWREFEEKLSPGTLRDEIRLGRIQVQYLDGEKEAALNELRDWFAEMEPIQSMTLAAELCLPEGVDPEDESQSLMLYGVMNQPEEEALECHKHYMAMRREIDKIVSPYNTLPRRKLRDTNAY